MTEEETEEPTRFIESNILLAVSNNDLDHARELLRTMYANELRNLADVLDTTHSLTNAEIGVR